MNQNEPPKRASTPTATEIARQRQARLEAAITPQGVGHSGRRERYTPPPDYPLQPCDFKRQTQFDSLPIEQACFVLLGFEPPPLDVLRFVQDTYNPSREPTWDEPPDYQDVLRSLRLSIGHGNVAAQRIREGRYETKHVSWPELVQWARSKNYAIPPELESQTAPVVTESAAAAPAKEQRTSAPGPKFSMRKDAMVTKYKDEWPTIERDIKDAAENGLSAAKAGARDWDEVQALEWARAKGKIVGAVKPADALTQSVNSMASIKGTKHTLRG